MREVILCFLLIGTVVLSTFAQESNGNGDSDGEGKSFEKQDWKLVRGANEFSVEVGFAPTQPTFLSGREEYNTDGRRFMLGSVRWGRVIGTTKGITYEYLFEAMPVAFAISNEVRDPVSKQTKKINSIREKMPVGFPISNEVLDPVSKETKKTFSVRENTYGAAIHPAGFRFVFLPKRRLKPYIQTSAGFIFTQKPIPVPESPNYNFSGDFGGGLMYSVSRFRTINFGYRYFHISNMNIGEINPGYNANVFYIGYSSFYK